jgi:RHS repeat-associated protein
MEVTDVPRHVIDADGTSEIASGYVYDEAGRLSGQWGTGTWDGSGAEGSGYLGTASAAPAYTYSTTSGLKITDNLRLASLGTAGTISAAYTYTDAGRLATATVNGATETYTFDPAGNLTSLGTGTSLVYPDNRLASMTAGGITNYFAFDAGKRWRTAQAPSADVAGVLTDPNRTTFAYTGTGRLSDYMKYTAGNEAAHGEYTYDSVGQRTKSVVTLGGTGGQETTTDFTYTGLTLHKLSATQTGGTATASWTITYLYDEYGKPYAGVYRDTTSTETPPAPVFFGMITTDRGDVVELLDKDGEPFAAYRYDAWGNPLGAGTDGAVGMWWKTTASITDVNVAKAIAQRQVLRYAGYCYDSESGLYYLSARHYDPVTRQFLSKDLSRNDGEQSAYQYCLGNPILNVDPTGLAPWWLHRIGSAFASAGKKIGSVAVGLWRGISANRHMEKSIERNKKSKEYWNKNGKLDPQLREMLGDDANYYEEGYRKEQKEELKKQIEYGLKHAY